MQQARGLRDGSFRVPPKAAAPRNWGDRLFSVSSGGDGDSGCVGVESLPDLCGLKLTHFAAWHGFEGFPWERPSAGLRAELWVEEREREGFFGACVAAAVVAGA